MYLHFRERSGIHRIHIFWLINTYRFLKILFLLLTVIKMDFDADFKILNKAISSFLKEASIKEKLQHILKRPNRDWEKWLQVELEYHLENHCRCDAKREVLALPDNRYRTGKSGMYVDLLIRKRNFEAEHYMYVELKCGGTIDNLYSKMLSDVRKLESIKKSFLDKSNTKMRSYWCIGFFHNANRLQTKEMKTFLKESYSTKTECKAVDLCTCLVADDSCECNNIGYIIF